MGSTSGSGNGIFGGTLGVNWQNGWSVVGIEGDYSWADISSAGQGGGPGGSCTNPCHSKLATLGTLRGRVGFTPAPSLLLYATGGAAFAEFHNSEAGFGGNHGRDTGWTAGGGIEGMLMSNWTWKAEYLFAHFDKDMQINSITSGPHQASFGTNIIRLGLNYKFGSQ